MKRSLIRYTTRPERADENERLIGDVFEELHAKSPEGVRYLAVKLGDGGFVHLVMLEDGAGGNPITTLAAFRAFRDGIVERCSEPPQSQDATVVGNYRMLAE